MAHAGFNLIGYATSPIGLGEDLRSFAAMLEYLDIPFSIVDVPTDSSGRVRLVFKKLSQASYATSVFFMSAMECQKLSHESPHLFAEPKTKIGYFLWELPNFPDEYVSALKLVDHIWCPSKFVQQAFFAKSKQLILSLPLPVIQARPAGVDFRAQLGIPAHAFVALFMFDLRSTLNRKNPQGALAAFSQFAHGKDDVYFILKINRWEREAASGLAWLPKHSRIPLITQTLSAPQLSDLYRASNCYLSLHRSEGFGRTLVEAMQHGLWLVSSHYSGPEDFLNAGNSHAVPWVPKTVLKGDYPHSHHSMWADPIASEAAQQLERIYQYERIRRNEAGVRTGAQFTLAALAEKYRPILQSYLR